MSRQPIQDLNSRHYLIMDMVLQGLTNKQIASELNLTESSVSVIRCGPQFQHELNLRQARRNDMTDELASTQIRTPSQADQILAEAAAEAAQKLVNSLRDDSDRRLQRLCANDVLDRTGHAKVARQESTALGVIAVLDPSDVARIKETFDQVQQMQAAYQPKDNPDGTPDQRALAGSPTPGPT